ncbi:hypothetical protein [Dickeya dadantii]|uniref:hypothetical protein n=2 Tax=Dickeya dadantii TaxID=204038 RepID=UPI0021DAF48F|nr:hypothetical protein [Dickeya dadantii]
MLLILCDIRGGSEPSGYWRKKMKGWVLLLAGLMSGSAFAEVNCEKLDNKAFEEGKVIDGAQSAYQVGGKGRLYFYSAPDDTCLNKQLFIVVGDKVTVYRQWNGFYAITYYNPAGELFDGWVKGDRLSAN